MRLRPAGPRDLSNGKTLSGSVKDKLEEATPKNATFIMACLNLYFDLMLMYTRTMFHFHYLFYLPCLSTFAAQRSSQFPA
jgi:hypothetical protein